MPGTVASRNLYITNSTPTTYLYATGITAATYDMAAALPGSPASPPFTSLAPSYTWAAASSLRPIRTVSRTRAPIRETPMRPIRGRLAPGTITCGTRVKYDMPYFGPAGYIAGPTGHIYQLSLYNLVNGQAAPTAHVLRGKPPDASCRSSSRTPVTPPYNHFLGTRSANDVLYHPDMYYTELAFMQALQRAGIALININALSESRLATRITRVHLELCRSGPASKPGAGTTPTARARTCSGSIRAPRRTRQTCRRGSRRRRIGWWRETPCRRDC